MRNKAVRSKWRASGRGVAALLSLHRRAVHRVNAPGGTQYEEAKKSFEALAVS